MKFNDLRWWAFNGYIWCISHKLFDKGYLENKAHIASFLSSLYVALGKHVVIFALRRPEGAAKGPNIETIKRFSRIK